MRVNGGAGPLGRAWNALKTSMSPSKARSPHRHQKGGHSFDGEGRAGGGVGEGMGGVVPCAQGEEGPGGYELLAKKESGADDRKRVMIMMSDTGGGHRASAEALEDAFNKLYPGGWPSLVFNLRGLVEGPREPPGASFPAFRTLTKVAIARWGSQARLSAISLTCGQTTRAGRIMRSCPFTSSCRSTPTRGASFGDTVRGGYRGHRQRQPASARATRERRLVRQG